MDMRLAAVQALTIYIILLSEDAENERCAMMSVALLIACYVSAIPTICFLIFLHDDYTKYLKDICSTLPTNVPRDPQTISWADWVLSESTTR